jgi:8-oxo-dGTP diphosphatase
MTADDGGVVRVVGAAIIRDGRCLAAQRSPAMAEPLKWEFPGGKVEAGEDPRTALRREVGEELGLRIAVGGRLGRGDRRLGDRRIALEVFAARVVSGRVRLAEHCRYGWFRAEEIERLDWAPADRPLLAAVKQLLGN